MLSALDAGTGFGFMHEVSSACVFACRALFCFAALVNRAHEAQMARKQGYAQGYFLCCLPPFVVKRASKLRLTHPQGSKGPCTACHTLASSAAPPLVSTAPLQLRQTGSFHTASL